MAQRGTEELRFPSESEDFISSLSQQQTHADALWGGGRGTAAAVSPALREGLVGRDGGRS